MRQVRVRLRRELPPGCDEMDVTDLVNSGQEVHEKDLALATDYYLAALLLDGEDATAWYNAGVAFIDLDLLPWARTCLLRAVELGENPEAQFNLNLVETMLEAG